VVSEPQHRWATVSDIQTEINYLRDTITYCERQILEKQQAMTTIAEIRTENAKPQVKAPPMEESKPKRSSARETIMELFAGRNGDIVPLQDVLSSVRGFTTPTVHLAMADLVRAGSLERVGRGQYRKLKVSDV
jgi:hypothetical protein